MVGMPVHRDVCSGLEDCVWVVFGNQRLRALEDVVGQGLQLTHVCLIVHDLRDWRNLGGKMLPLFCIFLMALTSDNGGVRAAFRSPRKGQSLHCPHSNVNIGPLIRDHQPARSPI